MALETVVFAGESQLETIGEAAFSGCTSITSITIPASVTTIKMGVFANNNSLEEVVFEEGSKLETIEHWAFLATNLSKLTLNS